MLLNKGWTFYKKGNENNKIVVDLPYDAMLREKRSIESKGGEKVGFFEGGDYIYEKEITLESLEDKEVYFQFEGIYHDAVIKINNVVTCKHDYGYSDFIFNATKYLVPGVNKIVVECTNSDQPNSRWYTGAGIYRNVHIYVLPSTHIIPRSLRVKTLDYKTGKIKVSALLSHESETKLDLFDDENQFVCSFMLTKTSKPSYLIEVPNFTLWNPDKPYLYRASMTCGNQREEIFFGIRQVELDKNKGLLINGKKTILYGCCVHSDNGLLGAESYNKVEFRKAKKIKNAGYNAVRSAHNPMVNSFLDACDKIGLLVLDEYVDMWYIHKNKFDYAPKVLDNYQKDLANMVDKDYTHPSVIGYSIGNEVSETAYKEGIDLTGKMVDYLHTIDNSRFVTCGINGTINGFSKTFLSVYSNKKANKEFTNTKSGSDIFNKITAKFGQKIMKFFAKSSIVDKNTRGAYSKLDVAGYNYGITRYEKDLIKYPERFILGTETFCGDANEFYLLSQKHHRIIGDFVWSGVDYLGEAGFNSWVNGREFDFVNDRSGWITDGGGRLDILLNDSFEADCTKCAFRKTDVVLGVVSPYDFESPMSQSSWKFSRALRSYSFPGFEYRKTQVEVYSYHRYIELYLNDRLIKKFDNAKHQNHFCYVMPYVPGKLMAIAYDERHEKKGMSVLETNNNHHISVSIEEKQATVNELYFLHLNITNEKHQLMPSIKEDIEIVSIDNGTLIRFGNASPYNKDGYLTNKVPTYHGTCMAIIRPTAEGTVKVLIRTKSEGLSVINIPCVNKVSRTAEKEFE